MKATEMTTLGREELLSRLNDAEASLVNLRFKHGTSQLENPLELRRLKRNIARLRTIIREMELGIRKES